MKPLRFGAAAHKKRSVLCPECGKGFSVAAKAMSVACPHCSRRVILEDFRITGYHGSRDFATAGDIVVEQKATVSAPVKVMNLTVSGKLRGRVLARGSVEVTGTGQLRGDVTAPSLVVQHGGTLEGFCRIGLPPQPAVPTVKPQPATRAKPRPKAAGAKPVTPKTRKRATVRK